jgi:transposase
MARFTVDDKLSAIKRYLEGAESYLTIATSLSTSDSVLRN